MKTICLHCWAWLRTSLAVAAAVLFSISQAFGSRIVAWGSYPAGMPDDLTNAVAISCGSTWAAALKPDGTVVAWGANVAATNVPAGLSNVVAISAGHDHCLALKRDATVCAWGSNQYGQTNVPAGLSNVAGIYASQFYSLALLRDGSVKLWSNAGLPSWATNRPAAASNIVSVALSPSTIAAIRNDGMAVEWGTYVRGSDWTNLSSAALSTSASSGTGLRQNGTITYYRRTGPGYVVPQNLTNIVAIDSGYDHYVSLDSSGTVAAWGYNVAHQTNVPSGLSNVVAVAAALNYSMALVWDGPPAFYEIPNDQSVYAGVNATFMARAQGQPPLSYQWFHEGAPLDGATNCSLVLSNVQADAAGSYTVAVSNPSGAVSNTAALNVLSVPPFFVTTPTNTMGFQGSNVVLVSKADGPIPITYQWQFGGTNIAGATNASLSLTSLKTNQQGLYRVTASNAWGCASSDATLTLADLGWALNATNLIWSNLSSSLWYAQPYTSHDKTAAAACIGGTQSPALKTSMQGPGLLSFWWQCNTPPGPANCSLIIDGASDASTTYSSWTKQSVYLGAGLHDVRWIGPTAPFYGTNYAYLDEVAFTPGTFPAAIGKLTTNQDVLAGTNLVLIAAISGTPPLRYQWQFNGEDIPGASGVTSASALNVGAAKSLSLSNLQSRASGTYSFIISNDFGPAAVSNMAVNVLPSGPRILTQPASQAMVRGGQVTFSVSAQGSDPLSYQWQYNGEPIEGATGPGLTLRHLDVSQAGLYSVIVSNAIDSVASPSAQLSFVPTVIVGWGDNFFGQTNVPADLTDVAGIGAGWDFSLAIQKNGPVVNWGFPETSLPSSETRVIKVVGGDANILALNENGTLLSAGSASGNAPLLSGVIDIASGSGKSSALTQDGKITLWGSIWTGTNIVGGLSNVVAISGGWVFDIALKRDGTVVAYGNSMLGATNVPESLSNVVSTAAGWYHGLALKRDGTVVGWGQNNYGQAAPPVGLSNVVAISAGDFQSVALKSDGTVVAWGGGHSGEAIAPDWLTNVVAIASGQDHNLALLNDGSPFVVRQPWTQTVPAGDPVDFEAVVLGCGPLSYQWQFNGTNLEAATNSVLHLPTIAAGHAGNYRCVISNIYGSTISWPASLTVFPGRSIPVLTGRWLGSHNFELGLTRLSGHGDIVIYGSTDLRAWFPLLTNPPVSGSATTINLNTQAEPIRFYRTEER